MLRPDRVAPLPVTATQPPLLRDHPVPEETCPAPVPTVLSVVPDGTPVLVASGKPQELGAVPQVICAAWDFWLSREVSPTVMPATARTMIPVATSNLLRWRRRGARCRVDLLLPSSFAFDGLVDMAHLSSGLSF